MAVRWLLLPSCLLLLAAAALCCTRTARVRGCAGSSNARSVLQVLSNGLVPSGLAVVYGIVAGCVDVPLGPSLQLELWRAKLLTLLAGAYLGW